MSKPEGHPSRKLTRIVVLGGGFGGIYTAMYLEKLTRSRSDIELILVNRENYFVFQPMLPEIVSGNIGILDTVSPIHRLLPRTKLYVREIESVDLANRKITLAPDFWPRSTVIEYDHLVLGLGTVTDFHGMAGLFAHAMPFKNLADAIHLRNHLVHVLEEAAIETDSNLRRQLLTFVIAGGGFSGVEVAAELNDYVRRFASKIRLDANEIRVILVHSGERILDRELDKRLGEYAQSILAKRGVEFRMKGRLESATPDVAILKGGERISTKTLISTVPSVPNALVKVLDLEKDAAGKIVVDSHFGVPGRPGVWAVGDCVSYQYADNSKCPPTAQHAIRQAAVVAHNILASMKGAALKPMTFTGMGKMGSLGHRSAVAELFGRIRISGMLAWLMWRTVYWFKLPGLDRKIRVGIAWLFDLLLPPDAVQLKIGGSQGVSHVHYEQRGEIIREGELGDTMYLILNGEVEIVTQQNGSEQLIRRLKAPAHFGEMALLNDRMRTATVRAVTPVDLLALHRREFNLLVSNMPDLKKIIEDEADRRKHALDDAADSEAHEGHNAEAPAPREA